MRRTLDEKRFLYSQSALYKKRIDEMESAEAKVAWLLHDNPHLRDCDKCLIQFYWAKVDGFTELNSLIIHDLTPAETITRCRRHLQNDLCMFLPTDESVQEARDISEQALADWAINEKKLND